MLLDGRSPDAIAAAVQTLKAGELVGLPTETVYGLAADAGSDAAVARIFAAKGRPANHPLIVHVADASGVDHFAANVPDFARRLIDVFWPGPLTLILPRRPGVGAAAAGGQNSIGLRCPSHPVAQAVLRACAAQGVFGLAAPSANPFGRVSPTTAAHVQAGMGDALLVLDGGACDVGIESAIVDCTRLRPMLLRPGVLTRAALERVLGCALDERDAGAPRAPGTLEAHYAPQAALRLVDARMLRELPPVGPEVAVYSRTRPDAPDGVTWWPMPADAVAAAHELFATLRALDRAQIREIWVEQPPSAPEWDGVRDRLRRAAAGSAVDRPVQEMESK